MLLGTKKFFSVLCALALVVGLYPTSAWAITTAGEDSGENPNAELDSNTPPSPTENPDSELKSTSDIPADKDTATKDANAQKDESWKGYSSPDRVTDAETPYFRGETQWTKKLKESSDWGTNVSEPLVVGDAVYIVAGDTLQKIDKNSSEDSPKVLAEARLQDKIDSISRLAYSEGTIVVPIHGGILQAFNAETLDALWSTPLTGEQLFIASARKDIQSLSSLTIHDGKVYAAASTISNFNSTDGIFACVDLFSGELVWHKTNTDHGYYWDGAAVQNNRVVISDDAGNVSAYDALSGDLLSSLSLGENVRSTVVADDTNFYISSQSGTLYKLMLDAQGILSKVASCKFGFSSTSTPTIVGKKLIVGGQSDEGYTVSGSGWSYFAHYGLLAVIDLDLLETDADKAVTKIEKYRGQSDGYKTDQQFAGDIKSAPLVSLARNETAVYFTSNATPGGIFVYRLGDDEAIELFLPDKDKQNYTMSSLYTDEDGILYYINDSGTLFAVKDACNGLDCLIQPGDDIALPNQNNPSTGGAGVSNTKVNKAASSAVSNLVSAGAQNTEASRAASQGTAMNFDALGLDALADNLDPLVDELADTGTSHEELSRFIPFLGILTGVVGLVGVAFWFFSAVVLSRGSSRYERF